MSQSRDWHPERRLLTIDEAALSIARPESTIRRWMATGHLTPFARIGRTPLIRESDLLETEARLRRTVTPVRDNETPPRER